MTKLTQASHYYDRMFESGGYGGIYELSYRHSGYYPLFQRVLKTVQRVNARAILEVGCGTGACAHLLMDRARVNYAGFDFSAVAVEKARLRTGKADAFFVGDALQADSYKRSYDTIVCSEVLEHIESDFRVLEQWASGAYCICSVPNFDSESHVRFFRNEAEVRNRYGTHIELECIERIRKPVLSDISWRSYARNIRWKRNSPRDVLSILGVGTFDSLGGWFLFSGRKR
jgi:SAM-dependent methyltransferase